MKQFKQPTKDVFDSGFDSRMNRGINNESIDAYKLGASDKQFIKKLLEDVTEFGVNTVNGQAGDVTLTTDEISEGANLYYTDERARDAVFNTFQDSASIDVTADDGADTITIDLKTSYTDGIYARLDGATFTGQIDFSGSGRYKNIKRFNDLERGNTPPDAVVFGDYAAWLYDVGDDSHIDFILPPEWDSSSGLDVRVMWGINEAYATNSGEVQWRADWSAVPTDASEALNSPTHSGQLDSGDIDIPATAVTITDTLIGTIASGDLSAGDIIGIDISRIAIDAGNNPTADPGIVLVYIEYTASTLGSTV